MPQVTQEEVNQALTELGADTPYYKVTRGEDGGITFHFLGGLIKTWQPKKAKPEKPKKEK